MPENIACGKGDTSGFRKVVLLVFGIPDDGQSPDIQ
jgi:hypothetical protein